MCNCLKLWQFGLFLFLLTFFLGGSSECFAGSSHNPWNNRSIHWQGYSQGLSVAKKTRKPVILVFYADWCPTCQKYGKVFQDKDVIQAAAEFVMIRVNIDQKKNLSSAYDFDGTYVPRTFALNSDGEVMHQFYPPKQYKYYIGLEPHNLLSLMESAISQNF